ncbi:MAG: DUF3047 domain-containing protein, partial [Spirochaetales bacterium]|nr:DUF3047 domain-containing protein [Spirochaetales bacterium]
FLISRFVTIFLVVVLPASLCVASEPLIVGNFSVQPVDGALLEGWQPLFFDGVDNHTVYTHILEDGVGVIQASSAQSSSGLVRNISIDVNEYSTLSFRWKIQKSIPAADLTQKKGDDAPARVYITFAYDSSQVSWWEVVKFEAIKLIYGEYPPIGALTYVWASHELPGTILDSPYTNRVKIIVLESGTAQQGQWLAEQRDIQADYQKAFGVRDVPLISGVAIMTDTDNTGEQAVAWYGDIIFSN